MPSNAPLAQPPAPHRRPWPRAGLVLGPALVLALLLAPGLGRSTSQDRTRTGDGVPVVPAAAAAGRVSAPARALHRATAFFVANRGQRPSDIHFHAGGRDGGMGFRAGGITIDQTTPLGPEGVGAGLPGLRRLPLGPETARYRRHRLEMRFLGARAGVLPEGEDRLTGVVNYFKGPREAWRVGIPTYAGLIYRDLWPGIDLEWVGSSDGFKYRYIVRPGADPARIRVAWSGVERLRIDAEGGLVIATPLGKLRDDRPLAWQEGTGGRDSVVAAHRLEMPGGPGLDAEGRPEPAVSAFAVGDYDRGRDLIIDPVVPVYAGFLGYGSEDRGLGVATDGAGHAYLTGQVLEEGQDFTDAFVARVALDGSSLDYLSIIGGEGGDAAFDIAIDAAGHAYITGFTGSDESSFPVTGGPDLSFNGVADTLVAKLAPDGQDLVYAGFLGGELIDFGEGIRVDASGSVYLQGPVLSSHSSFPVKVGPDLSFNGETDIFVCKLVPEPTAPEVVDNLSYCGYIGGAETDIHMAVDGADSFYSSGHIAIDAAGALYVSGETTSNEGSFPGGNGFGDLPGPDQSQGGGWDAYIVKVRPDGVGFAYAGFIGGAGDDFAKGMSVDAQGNAYLSGYTGSDEGSLPVTVGPDLSFNGGDLDTLVAKVRADGGGFSYLGYLGGDDTDGAEAVVVDPAGALTLVGYTESGAASFPVKEGPDLSQNDTVEGAGDAFIARVRPIPSAADPRENLDFAGYIGGAGTDQAYWVTLDASGAIYVSGDTESDETSFPGGNGMGAIPGWDRVFHGARDAFLLKLWFGDGPPPTPAPPTPTPTSAPSPTTPPTVAPAGGKVFLPLALQGAPLGGQIQPEARAASGAPARIMLPTRSGPDGRTWTRLRMPPLAALLAAPPRRSGSAPPAPARIDQVPAIETSYDDFCDFGIGWSWEDNADFASHLAADERLRCYYKMRMLTATAYGSVSNGHNALGEFMVETAFEIHGEDSYGGLIFGAPPALNRWYTFAVTDDGRYVLARVTGGQATGLATGSAPVDPALPNHIVALVRTTSIALYVNGVLVDTVEDLGAHAGRVGVYTEWGGTGEALEHRYDYIRISRLGDAAGR